MAQLPEKYANRNSAFELLDHLLHTVFRRQLAYRFGHLLVRGHLALKRTLEHVEAYTSATNRALLGLVPTKGN